MIVTINPGAGIQVGNTLYTDSHHSCQPKEARWPKIGAWHLITLFPRKSVPGTILPYFPGIGASGIGAWHQFSVNLTLNVLLKRSVLNMR